MSDLTLLGPWVRRFLLEHLVAERNLARNTQRSYRDALTLLIPFVADKLHRSVDRLTLVDVSADLVRLFLADLEQSRQCTIATRNQRLAAIHALARFVGEHSPEHIAWCGQIRSIPFKKTSKAVIPYLDKPEMDALLSAPDRQTAQGRRDHALLLFLYNSGTRAQEAAQLLIGELDRGGLLCENSRQRWQREAVSSVAEHRLRNSKLSSRTAPRQPVSSSIAAGIPSHASASTTSSSGTSEKSRSRCPRWLQNGSAPTPFDIRRPHTCSAPAWTSTPSAPGSGMCLSTRPTFTQKSIWR